MVETLPRRKLLDRGDEAIVTRFQQGRRRHRRAKIVVQEVAQAAGRLELGHVGVQIHTVDAANLERDVLADNRVDVGRHRTLLAGKADDGTPSGTPRPWTTPDILRSLPAMRADHDAAPARSAVTASEAAPVTLFALPRRFEAQLRWQPVVKVDC